MHVRNKKLAAILYCLILKGGLCLCVTLITTACGIISEDEAAREFAIVTSGGAMSVFQTEVHTLTTQTCAGCHGSSQQPLFAVGEVEQAYNTMWSVISRDDISSSKILRKANDGHCGGSCVGAHASLEDGLKRWMEAETEDPNQEEPPPEPPTTPAAPTEFNFDTMTVLIPANLGDDVTTVTISLNGLGAVADGTEMTLDIQRFGNQAYRVSNLRLNNGPQGLLVEQIGVSLNDVYLPENNAFVGISKVFESGDTNVEISNADMIMLEKNGPGMDTIGLGFNTLDVFACQELDLFVQNVLPIMENNCKNCHRSGGAQRAFDLDSTSNDILCGRASARIDFDNAQVSQLYRRPLGNSHSRRFNADDQRAIDLLAWIQAEIAAN